MARKLAVVVAALLIVVAVVGGGLILRHRQGVAHANTRWATHRPKPIGDIGTTKSLSLLPLVDWHASRPGLLTDMGVSYLVKTDRMTILFDTGNNSKDASPSPLEHNMKQLGVALQQIDAVVISHAHYDHIGGRHWSDGAVSGTTFGIGNSQPDLTGKRVVVPTAMTYPGIKPTVATDPMRLAPGVATTGTIPRKLLVGPTEEQALVVNVEGKGLVLIVGCGHQTLTRLIERVERVFDTPIYGVIGGLHYPVPNGRITVAGINVQRVFASGRGPFAPLSRADVDAELALLEARHVGVVGIGGHDSSDQVIEAAAKRFAEAYRHVEVGRPIVLPGL